MKLILNTDIWEIYSSEEEIIADFLAASDIEEDELDATLEEYGLDTPEKLASAAKDWAYETKTNSWNQFYFTFKELDIKFPRFKVCIRKCGKNAGVPTGIKETCFDNIIMLLNFIESHVMLHLEKALYIANGKLVLKIYYQKELKETLVIIAKDNQGRPKRISVDEDGGVV